MNKRLIAVSAIVTLLITCLVVVRADESTSEVLLLSASSVAVPRMLYLPCVNRSSRAFGVHISWNHSAYVDAVGYLHIVGEVENNTRDYLRFVKISANVFDNSERLLDTAFTYAYLDNLPAGDRTCFHILLEEPAGWAYYRFEPPSYWTDGRPLPNLVVSNDSGSYDSTYGWYEILGQVRNDHGRRVEYVSPVGTLYDTPGTVLGCDFTYVNSTHLDPGQTSSFKMNLSGRDYAGVSSYRVQVDGNPK